MTTSQVISLYLSPIYSPSVMCLEEVTSHGNAKRWFAVCTGEQTKVRDQLDQLTAGGQAGNSELVMNPLPITKHTINTLKQIWMDNNNISNIVEPVVHRYVGIVVP